MTSGIPERSLHLAVELDGDGGHPAAWRFSGRVPSEALTPQAIRAAVTAAEAGGFTLVTFADSPVPPSTDGNAAGRLDAVGRAAFVSTLTDRIGLAPAAHVTTTEPFHLAAQLASLDHASKGRAAWFVGATNEPDALATIGAEPLSAKGLRREVRDVVEVVRRLWDSWEDDAVIKDVATGRYLDPDRVHHVDFEGRTFNVTGPLITPRPPQGQPVVLADAALGTIGADITLVGADGLDDLKQRVTRARETGAALVFAELEVVLNSRRPAAARLEALDSSTPWHNTGRLRFTGSAQGLVELLGWADAVVDGVRLHPAVLAEDLPPLIGQVLPALREAGLHTPPAPGQTLRSALGLSHPANRFAVARRS
jgi:alkanesulfonate monooxygenase SsuD/methylene tetrahydromethanopterin reductase-like flavin-dependent oxidoreductase (luciferase family)